jgi:putative flavoprotein involved in K+ transport
VVVGAGQAGLAVAYYLKARGIDHLVLERSARVGDVWRARWDTLRLFTPAQLDGLPGLPFPALKGSYPTKDAMAGFLETYVDAFALPVRVATRVGRLSSSGQGFLVTGGGQPIEAAQVVVATGAYQSPRVPAWGADLDPSILQLHAVDYHGPIQLREGPVLVVGAGNSGAEIAVEVAQAGHRTWLSGRATGQVPEALYVWDGRLFRFLANRVTSVRTPIGRRVRRQLSAHGGPLIRLTMNEVRRAGVEHVPRVTAARDAWPVLEDGRLLEAANVVWCTGFGHDFSWIDLPVLGPDGMPEHDRGVVVSRPGLYFVGLPFLSKLGSSLICGVEDDAKRVVAAIAAGSPAR